MGVLPHPPLIDVDRWRNWGSRTRAAGNCCQ